MNHMFAWLPAHEKIKQNSNINEKDQKDPLYKGFELYVYDEQEVFVWQWELWV